MKKIFDLQMFSTAVSGKKLVYLYRIQSEASTTEAVTLAFTTENTRTKSKEAESTETKDGPIRTPGATEGEITCTSLLIEESDLISKLEEAMDNGEIIEVWEANLEKGVTEGKYDGRYFQAYITEMEITSNAEDFVEVSLTFALIGTGVKGEVSVTTAQQEIAAYVFRDTRRDYDDPI